MDLWEYKIEPIDLFSLYVYEHSLPEDKLSDRENYLNIKNLGEDGWELIETKDIPVNNIQINKGFDENKLYKGLSLYSKNIKTIGIFKRKLED